MKKLWGKLNGKKTAIGIGLHAAWFISNIIFKDLSTYNESLVGHAVIGSLTGVGLGHKGIKIINKAIDRANQK